MGKIMSSKYWNPSKIVDDWYYRLYEAKARAGTDKFSIVYRFYSTINGPIRYVGRSDSPINRLNGHVYQMEEYGIHGYLDAQLSWVDFKYYTGQSRFKEAYEEECKQWHNHDPDLNSNHPHKIYESWVCPICGK